MEIFQAIFFVLFYINLFIDIKSCLSFVVVVYVFKYGLSSSPGN